jgi:hypothetical protein
MNWKIWASIATALTAMALAITGNLTGVLSTPGPNPCQLSQPVYAKTVLVGTFTAALHPGQSVTLPDSDTATCTIHGLTVR